jgi:Cation transporter/ATPase, N-terminus
MDHSFTRSPAELLRDFSVSEEAGLTQAQVLRSRENHGANGKLSQRNERRDRGNAENEIKDVSC